MSYKLKTKIASALNGTGPSNIETLGLVSLEPRILLDAAGFVTGAEVAMESLAIEGAEFGVQAIFESEGGDDVTATPREGPWLGSIALAEGDDDVTATPREGPWLGSLSLAEGDDGVTATPREGPWL